MWCPLFLGRLYCGFSLGWRTKKNSMQICFQIKQTQKKREKRVISKQIGYLWVRRKFPWEIVAIFHAPNSVFMCGDKFKIFSAWMSRRRSNLKLFHSRKVYRSTSSVYGCNYFGWGEKKWICNWCHGSLGRLRVVCFFKIFFVEQSFMKRNLVSKVSNLVKTWLFFKLKICILLK